MPSSTATPDFHHNFPDCYRLHVLALALKELPRNTYAVLRPDLQSPEMFKISANPLLSAGSLRICNNLVAKCTHCLLGLGEAAITEIKVRHIACYQN